MKKALSLCLKSHCHYQRLILRGTHLDVGLDIDKAWPI